MFDYMDVKTQEDARHISLDELYAFSSGAQPPSYPRLVPYMNDDRFWSDLCKEWFNIRPFNPRTAKLFFRAEYLFQKGDHKAAAEQHSFNALFYFFEKHCAKQKYNEAFEVADLITEHYGVVGVIINLNIYSTIFSNSDEQLDDAQEALSVLETIDAFRDNELSNYYFTELQWQEQMKAQNCNSLAEYKQLVKVFFEERIPQAVLGP